MQAEISIQEQEETDYKSEKKKGNQLLELIEERRWEILNGNKTGDNEAELNYVRPREQ